MAMVGRMAGDRERAYALLNDAKMQNDSTAKTENLKQLLEILLNREPSLIPEFVPNLMDFQTDPSSPVLKYLAEIIEEIGLKSSDQLPFMVPVLVALLRDNTPAVARRAISSGTNLFRNTLEQVALQGIYTGQVDVRLQEAWAWMIRFKDAVYPAAYHHGNDGVRLQAIKFVETTVLLFTPDSNGSARPPAQQQYVDGTAKGFNIAWIAGGHPVLDPGAMGQEASKNVGSLLNQLRPFESSALPGPVAIVLVNSLAAVAKRRPSLYGRVLPVLLGLAPSCENIKGGQVASVVHALKNAFISLLKCQHSGAGPWRDRLVGALRSMNAGDVADSTMRSIDRALRNADRERASRDPRAVKDERMQPAGQVADVARKRPVMQENGNLLGESESSNGKRLRVTHHSGAVMNMQRDMPNNAMDTGAPPATPVPMDTGLTPIQQMISMIGALVAQGERAAASVELLITNIAADMLADIVIANMTHLPSTPPPVEEVSAGGESRAVGNIVSILSPTPELAASPAMSTVLAPPPLQAAPTYVAPPVIVTPPLAPPTVVVPPVLAPPVLPVLISPLVVPPAAETLNPQSSAEARRDPRRQDPRRLDPRRSSAPGVSPSAKDEDTTMTGSPVAENELVNHLVDVKREPLAPVMRDPREVSPVLPSPVGLSAPILAQVKAEPVEEKPSSAGTRPLSPPAASVSVPLAPPQPVPLVASVKTEHPAVVLPPFSSPTSGAAPAPTISKDGRAGTSMSSSGLGGGMGSAGIPVNVPVPTLPVISLTEEQQVALGKAALVRILEGHKTISAAGGNGLRIALLARLVAQSCEDEQAVEVVRKHILADYQNHKGHELALHVLYQLYAEQASEEGTSSASSSPISLAYDKLLLSLAQGLRDTLPPADKALSRLLAEVPVLPMTALDLLQGLCNPALPTKDGKEPLGGDRITQGLSAIWSLILQRPPARETCLKLALQCAVHEVDDIRAKAIRLVANKLYPLSYVADSIEGFALDMLQSVVESRQTPVDGVAKDPMDVDEGEPSLPQVKKEEEEREQSSNGDQRLVQGSDEVSINESGGRNVHQSSSGTVSMTEAQRCMSLFFALCTKKHSLLRQLFSVYGHVSKTVKQAVHRHIPILFRTIGSSSAELLQIISDPPAGSEHLLLQVLHSLTEGSTPSQELIATVKKLYETKLQDAVFLIPVLSSLTKDEVLPIFPRLVDLPPEKFQTALARILQGSAHTGPALTPTEVLIALHGIDPNKDSVPLKKVMDACSACLQQRTVFTHQVLAKVLNQLVEQTPLPLLFMRTVIQAVGAFPSLVSFVMEILSRLVNKQIWKFPKLWIGFLKCANQTVPNSFHVLLQLPLVQLEDAFTKHPNLKGPLATHASQPNIRSTVPRSSLVLLGLAAQDESNATPPQSLPEGSAVEMQVKH
ncbi:symplekin [Marchantia polymorpha subsp. ruderalis]|uniref:Symplekin n=2 Tax=Marchantia polymorpha TaxID=3197 RepID=A0AAF6BN47_MARPO|nr:hypothetical protein MARPO_0035s0121 [Marchantia polymorpha]BBN13431.1 hypothetical protein Mp_6g03410 [Marchantia polymorpha subsp. ruderalis]|eukprot:PTQ41352.1 hypothetical protein MARPO_0035s0121 [Marchantia polymorpha]